MNTIHQPLVSSTVLSIKGIVSPPGDKSISHRSVILGGIAEGTTIIKGLLEGEDVLCTIEALKQLGAKVEKEKDIWRIEGTGIEGLKQPNSILYMGNSGTSARLLIGLLGTRPFRTSFNGDASLCKRPMNRVITPLKQMGAEFESAEGRLPLTVIGSQNPKPIAYRLPMASAQVKSAILLAGLSVNGKTTVIEPIPTRDHTERMLKFFGADLEIEKNEYREEIISVRGIAKLKGQEVVVPGDISSAAFPLVAALICPDSELAITSVGINPRRSGLLDTLKEMGAEFVLNNIREICGEPTADIKVKTSRLKGITVPPDRVPSMIDEYPILAIAAACAEGTTRMCGLGELRVKESDRLSLTAEGLKSCGVKVEIENDDLIVHGEGKPPQGGAKISTSMDHRIAMSFLVLGMASREAIAIDDSSMIATSFPGFAEMMNKIGAKIENEKLA